VEAILYNVGQWINYFASQSFNAISQSISDIGFFVQHELRRILDFMDVTFQAIAVQYNKMADAMDRAIEFIFKNATAMISYAVNQLVDVSVGAIDAIQRWAEAVLQKMSGLISSAMGAAASLADRFVQIINGLAQGVFRTLENFATFIANGVQKAFSTVVVSIQALIDKVIAQLNLGIQKVVGTADSLVSSLETRLSDLRKAFGEAAEKLVEGLTEKGEELFAPIRDQIIETFEGLATFADPKEVSTMMSDINRLTSSKSDPVELKQFIDGAWRRFAPTKGIWATIFFMLVSIAGQLFFFIDAGRINSQIMMQGLALQFPFQLLTPGDAANAYNRGFISQSEAMNMIKRQGYADNLAMALLSMSATFPQEGEVLNQWHRGLINEMHVDVALKALNRPADFIKATKEASFLIPPVGDLITMAVREVFSPEIAARFGQFEDFPKEFAEWARKQGLSEEWSQRYWAAHWALPSPNQGFEMLHRGVINEQELELLLRALDVMPFWRNGLTQIAYSPFTRVDIRRMHAMGLLTEEEVFVAHKEIGYDADKARKLTAFTIALNKPAAADDEAELKELSRAQILSFFGDGLMNRERAMGLLDAMGYTPEAAGLMLSEVELSQERAERKAEIQLTLDLAKAGVLTIAQAEDRLNRLGLETIEVGRALSELIRESQRRTKLPTRAEAEQFFRQKLITEAAYRDILETLGYAEKWVKAYIEEAKRA